MVWLYRSKRCYLLLLGILSAILVLLVAGKSEQEALHCRFGLEHRVINTEKKLFDAIDLVVYQGNPVTFWSDASGLYGRLLKSNGMLLGPVVSIGPRCKGGIDTSISDTSIYLACLRHSRSSYTDSQMMGTGPWGDAITVYQLNHRLEVQWTGRFGQPSPMGKGISIAVRQDMIWVAWHAGFPSGNSVWMTEIINRQENVPRIVSNSNRSAGAPFISVDETGIQMVWEESWVETDNLHGEIMFYNGRRAPFPIQAITYHAAMPQLLKMGKKTLLAYQDQPNINRTVGLYFGRLGSDGQVIGEVRRVARADTEERPSIDTCADGIVTASPRTYGQDRLIGVNWFDMSFSRISGEQQFCEDAREFSIAKAVCTGSKALLLVGERGSSTQKYTTVRSVTFWCSS